MRLPRDPLTWFRIVVAVGIPLNLYFVVPALFVPSYVVDQSDLRPGFETVWLRNAGLLVAIVTAYHVVAALAPQRYPAVAWLTVAGRLAAGCYWLFVVFSPSHVTSTPEAFWPFVIGDFAFGGVSGVLLYRGLRGGEPVHRYEPAG
jgi:hypothetical protein